MKVPQKYLGRTVRCPAEACHRSFKIERPAQPAAAAPESRASRGESRTSVADKLLADYQPPAVTLSNKATASNPGQLKVNFFRWIRHKPFWPVVLSLLLVASVALVVWYLSIFTVPVLLLMLAINYLYWKRVKEHFHYGCANAGMVVDLNPTLVAVILNLSKGLGDYPAIKILKANLQSTPDRPLAAGTPIATVALYSEFANKHGDQYRRSHWDDSNPLPVDYVTGDPEVIAGLLATFVTDKENDFQELEEGLQHLAQPYEPGLYFLWEAGDKKPGRLAATIDEVWEWEPT